MRVTTPFTAAILLLGTLQGCFWGGGKVGYEPYRPEDLQEVGTAPVAENQLGSVRRHDSRSDVIVVEKTGQAFPTEGEQVRIQSLDTGEEGIAVVEGKTSEHFFVLRNQSALQFEYADIVLALNPDRSSSSQAYTNRSEVDSNES